MRFSQAVLLGLAMLPISQVGNGAVQVDKLDQKDSLDARQIKQIIAFVEKMKGHAYEDTKGPVPVLRISDFREPLKDADAAELAKLMRESKEPIFLDLDFFPLTDAGLAHFKDLATLQGLILTRTKVTEAGVQFLADMKNLEVLRLPDHRVSNDGLKHLAKLTKLRELQVDSRKISDAGFIHLANLTQLEVLHVGNYFHRISDVGLAHMKAMTKLKSLYVGGEQLTDAGLAHIGNLGNLQSLRIENCMKVTKAGLANLARLPKLEVIAFDRCPAINGQGMACLKELRNIERLDFARCGSINLAATSNLAGFSKLETLCMDDVEDEAIKGINGLTCIQELRFFRSGIGDAGLEHMSGLTGLRSIYLSDAKITGTGLKHLSRLPNLHLLDVSGNMIADAGLKDLGPFASLQGLYMRSTKISDKGLQFLSQLSNLESLELRDCNILGSGLQHLGRLPKLRYLGLAGNRITDANLLHLHGMKCLTGLSLTGTKTTDDGLIALNKALPKARIRDYAGLEFSLKKKDDLDPKKMEFEDLTKFVPAFTLTAEALQQECLEDPDVGERYKDKVIDLIAEVGSYTRYRSGVFHLRINLDKRSMHCQMADLEPWSRAVSGQKVKIRCRVAEAHTYGIRLQDGVFIEAGPCQAIKLEANQLANEYAADPKATRKKYEGKTLILSGELLDKWFTSSAMPTLSLKVEKNLPLQCHFDNLQDNRYAVRQIKIGQQVRILCYFDRIDPKNHDEIRLIGNVVLTPP